MVDSVGVGEEMATMRLGSKSEVFHREGQTWNCTTGLPSDVVVEVGGVSFNLHKFPLLSRSGTLEKIISALPTGGSTSPSGDATISTIQLHDLPGGALAFELIAKFCYGVKLELTATNVVAVRCASEHLQMTEEYGERNLILHAENFLQQLLGNWKDTLQVLNKCEGVLPESEDLQIVSRCINSLAIKASSDTTSFGWPTATVDMWNGIGSSSSRARQENIADMEWWHEDVAMLSLSLYKRFVTTVGSRGVKAEFIAGSVVFYAKRHLPGLSKSMGYRDTSNSDPDQKLLLEEIIQMLPAKKGVTSTKLLLLLLRTSMILGANTECKINLERRVGVQLEDAVVEDLLMPNLNYSADTLYDVECVQRVLDHFMGLDQSGIVEEDNLMDATPILMVGKLVDGYLAEVASDANLKFPIFQALAATIPDYARPIDDGLYRAIDIYLKAHPWLTDSEREQLCHLMNCQKLSLEACTHAAQNERLPLRMVVQVLFFEQLRLRTSIASWFFVSDNLDASQNPANAASSSLALVKRNNPSNQQGKEMSVEEMRARVFELERECSSMKVEIEKVGKGKAPVSSWSLLPRRLGMRLKAQPFCAGDEVSTDCQKGSGGNRRKLELLDV